MKRERYHNVWQRGYEQGASDATEAVRHFVAEGGQFAVGGFGHDLSVKHKSGMIGVITSVLALGPFLRRFQA